MKYVPHLGPQILGVTGKKIGHSRVAVGVCATLHYILKCQTLITFSKK
jgi:hypothetical protein